MPTAFYRLLIILVWWVAHIPKEEQAKISYAIKFDDSICIVCDSNHMQINIVSRRTIGTIDVSFEIECTCDNSFDKCGSIHNYMLINRREDFMLHAKHIFIIIRETMCLCYSTAYTHFHENLKCRRIRFSLYSLDWIFMLKQFLSEFMMYDKIDSKPEDEETSDWAAENERIHTDR